MSDGASDDDVGPEPGREVWIEKYRPESLDDVLGHDNITERLEGYVERNDVPHLLFAGPAGTGKCVTGETPVLTNRGTERIEDVVGDVEGFGPLPAGLKVLTLGEDGTFQWVRPAAGFGQRTDELVSVRTRDGAVLTVTPEHKLLVDGNVSGLEWSAAVDLSPGEGVARPRRFPRPRAVMGNNHESRHLFADGGIVRQGTTRASTADLCFGEVESVRRRRAERRVYDLTVPGTRNYVAGEVPTVMHNTTAAVAIARELYGEEWRENFLELNASDERGIDVVRERIKNFARASFGGFDYRIIFLDEADALCVPPETEVVTGYPSSPEVKKIEDVAEDGEPIPSVDFETNEIQSDKGRLVDSGIADFFEVELTDGRAITASLTHPFFVVGEDGTLVEKELRELSPGDEIADFEDDIGVSRCDTCGDWTAGDEFEPALVSDGGLRTVETTEIRRIEYSHRGKAYNISMEGTPNFVLANGILTHNTSDAQAALRRTMEQFSNNTRFVLSCVTPDTRVLLPGERETTMGEFIEEFEQGGRKHVANIEDSKDRVKRDLALATVTLPPERIGKDVLEIRTMTGREITVTEDHMLRTPEGWKEAGSLTETDELVVYPHLEATGVEENKTEIIDRSRLKQFLHNSELEDGKKTMENAGSFEELATVEKKRVLKRVGELIEKVESGDGLTEREHDLYRCIAENPGSSRQQLQEMIGLSRQRTNQLLQSIERIEEEFGISVAYSTIYRAGETKFRGRVDRVSEELDEKGLLDVTYADADKLGALARICGFMLGDGHIARNNKRLHFAGNNTALSNVKDDLDAIGYHNHSAIRSNEIRDEVYNRTICGTSTSFTLDSTALSHLLQFLGVPSGDKTVTPFSVPNFVKNGTTYVKREFLRALFGCDGDTPRWDRMTFEAVMLRQNKTASLEKSIRSYYAELSELLAEFNVDAYVETRDKGEVRERDDTPVKTFNLVIQPNNENCYRFFSRVGYAYEPDKSERSRLAAEYLRHKLHLIESQKQKSEQVLASTRTGSTVKEAAKEVNVSTDFVRGQQAGKDVGLPRNEFTTFDGWLESFQYEGELVLNGIERIEEVEEPVVMDITCKDDHNFITNGLISHNCNYSSDIIDPIQSRCTVFRFSPLGDEAVAEQIRLIADQEDIELTDDGVDALVYVANGDMRKAINRLQAAAVMGETVDEEVVYEITSAVPPEEIRELVTHALAGDFSQARSKLDDMIAEAGVAGGDIIDQIHRSVWEFDLDDDEAVALMERVGETDYRITAGANEQVQLEALLASLALGRDDGDDSD